MYILDTEMGTALLTVGVASATTILFGWIYYLHKGRGFRFTSETMHTNYWDSTKRKKIYLVTVLLLLGLCMTFFGRRIPTFRSAMGVPYPATITAIYLTISGGGILQAGDCNNAPMWAKVVGWSVVVPLSLAAIPGAFVIDTILLPVDLYRENGIYRAIKRISNSPP